ncbi:MAG TPA: carboxypeptidase-like regulatory domain-containing protein [Longimicrobiales bacterium]|nr:carboxypeptidase-like regulatory domain-containing protein [Longimicrobiales bacterium]
MLRSATVLGTAAALAVLPGTAVAAPATVNLRIEGATQTLFEGPVTTDGKTLTKDASGPHACDGTNGGANPTPGPTMTSALDDGAIGNGFTWDGTWFSFGDFGIDRIGPDAATSSQFWGYALNFAQVQVGGCQQQVKNGDQVLFAYDFFSKTHLLRLSGPAKAAVGEPLTVHVVDGQDGSPVPGAQVGGAATNSAGDATLSFPSPGTQTLKAEAPSSVRSNALAVCVYQPGSGACGTTAGGQGGAAPGGGAPVDTRDSHAPSATISSPRSGKRYRRGPRVLRGRATDDRALFGVYFRLRRYARGGCRYYNAHTERFSRAGHCAHARWVRLGAKQSWSYLLPKRLARGRYVLEQKSIDTAWNGARERVDFRVTR